MKELLVSHTRHVVLTVIGHVVIIKKEPLQKLFVIAQYVTMLFMKIHVLRHHVLINFTGSVSKHGLIRVIIHARCVCMNELNCEVKREATDDATRDEYDEDDEYITMVRNLHPDLVDIVLIICNQSGIHCYPTTYERFCDVRFWCPYYHQYYSYLQNIIDSELVNIF